MGRMDPRFDPLPIESRLGPYGLDQEGGTAPSVRWHPLLLGWAVGGYAEAVRVLGDAVFASDRRKASIPGLGAHGTPLPERCAALGEVLGRMLLFSDPPDHERLRRVVGEGLGPPAVARLRPALAQRVTGLLDRVDGEVEFMAEVANPLAGAVLADLLGVSPADRADFDRWSDALADAIDPRHADDAMERGQNAVEEMRGWLTEAIRHRRENPTDDLVGHLARAEEAGRIASDEVLATCALLGAVGKETSAHLLGNTVLLLLRHPEQRARLRERPTLLGSAIEESLRYESPAQLISRVATETVRLGPSQIGAGDIVVVHLGATGRDGDRFPDPARFDVARRPNPHLAFGGGPHGCPGAGLGRATARLAIGELLRRFPTAHGDPAAATWKRTVVHRGPSALPLSLPRS
jgi:pimeloyl-[acyl-carrier protein] synthase